LNRTSTVSPNCSRKSFFAKLGGLLAATGLAPALLAKNATKTELPTAAPVTIRPEQRAIARKDGSF
jgi:hypothetical protein